MYGPKPTPLWDGSNFLGVLLSPFTGLTLI